MIGGQWRWTDFTMWTESASVCAEAYDHHNHTPYLQYSQPQESPDPVYTCNRSESYVCPFHKSFSASPSKPHAHHPPSFNPELPVRLSMGPRPAIPRQNAERLAQYDG